MALVSTNSDDEDEIPCEDREPKKRHHDEENSEDSSTPAAAAAQSTAFITPVKFKSTIGSRSAFKAPFKSPLTSSPGASPAASPLSCGSKTAQPSSFATKSSPIVRSGAGLLRQVGGLSRPVRVAAAVDPVALQAKLALLRAKEQDLDEKIRALTDSGLDEKDLQKHMDQLHAYNESKDAAQTTFGRLANIRQCMIRDIYEDLGLELED
ncbi:hypothetical protein BV898_13813 [Hypsibius exemplaris]|uniref:DNA repair protein SWI5 homolog n=1 Tax=Hypsibius exemplaris TaxID=2072580 RepID=A0A1W0W9Q7_HYPEX|nr:hypothetical protein BV898_13813 [Hypsibius exemplaris]